MKSNGGKPGRIGYIASVVTLAGVLGALLLYFLLNASFPSKRNIANIENVLSDIGQDQEISAVILECYPPIKNELKTASDLLDYMERGEPSPYYKSVLYKISFDDKLRELFSSAEWDRCRHSKKKFLGDNFKASFFTSKSDKVTFYENGYASIERRTIDPYDSAFNHYNVRYYKIPAEIADNFIEYVHENQLTFP